MRVLYVINSLIQAGCEMLMHDLARGMRARGVDLTIAVLKTLDSPLEKGLRESGFPFLAIESDIYSPAHVTRLARHLGDYDLVHSFLFPAQLWVVAASRLQRSPVPLVTTEQSTTNNRRKSWVRPIDSWMYRQYAAIACNSEATRNSLREWVPAVRDRLSIIYNGVQLQRFQAAKPADRAQILPGRDRQRLAAFVARFDPAKDHDTLLRAIVHLPQLDLLLVGDGDSRPQVEQRCRDLGIAERVHFLGRRADIPQLLKMCDLYIHSSHWEGFGIAAVEAMAAGLPVIATDVPGLNEVVRDAGLLFPPGDDAALAAHLSNVLVSDTLRSQLAQSSLRRAPMFSMDRIVSDWMELYDRVLGSARRSAAYAD